MGKSNAVTQELLKGFKSGDLVNVRTRNLTWTGPHKLRVYKFDPAKNGAKPAAYMEIELDGKKLERWLIVGEQQIIRQHNSKSKATGEDQTSAE